MKKKTKPINGDPWFLYLAHGARVFPRGRAAGVVQMWGRGGVPAPSASTVFPAPPLTRVSLMDESFGVRVTLLSEARSCGQQAFFVLAPKMRLRHRLFLACPVYLKLRERNICLGRDTLIMDTVDRMSSRCCPAGVPWWGQEAPMGQGGAGQVHVALLRGAAALL